MGLEISVSFLWTSFHIIEIITPSVTVIARVLAHQKNQE